MFQNSHFENIYGYGSFLKKLEHILYRLFCFTGQNLKAIAMHLWKLRNIVNSDSRPSPLFTQPTGVLMQLGAATSFEDSPIVTTGQAARLLNVSQQTILNWIKSGKINASPTGLKQNRLTWKEINRVLKEINNG